MDGVDQRIVLARDKWNKFLGQLTRWLDGCITRNALIWLVDGYDGWLKYTYHY